MTGKFDFTVLMVTDITQAQVFYQHALGLMPRPADSSDYAGDYVEFATGDHRLGLVSHRLMVQLIPSYEPSTVSGTSVLISFKVENLSTAFQQALDAGATVKSAPTQRPWGQESAFIADLDGHLIELVQVEPLTG